MNLYDNLCSINDWLKSNTEMHYMHYICIIIQVIEKVSKHPKPDMLTTRGQQKQF